MDRRRAFGLLLVLVSACGFGSGGLFAQPVYEAGVGWQVLSAWRFGLAAVLAWLWVLAWAERRRGLRLLDRRTAGVAIALGVLYTANSGTYSAGLEVVPVSLASLVVYIYPAIVAVMSLRVGRRLEGRDRKSTRLNSSHGSISYAVFCLKKKKKIHMAYLDRHITNKNV